MRQQPRTLDVAQELYAQSMARCAPSIRPDIGDHELRKSSKLHHAQLRFERRERIVRDLRTRREEAVK